MRIKFLIIFIFFCKYFIYAQLAAEIPGEGLQGYWPFSGNSEDISGNNRHGKSHGSTLVKDRFGNKNNAFSFNGVSDYISTSYPGILGTHPRAVSFWAVLSDTTPGSAVSWGNNNLFPHSGGRFDCSFNQKRMGATVGVSDACITFETNDPVADGLWHHYVYQFSKTYLKEVEVYQDGFLLTHEPFRCYPYTRVNTLLGENMRLGALRAAGKFFYFKGKLDDVAIYDRALTIDEINALYHAPDPVKKIAAGKWILIGLIFVAFVLLATWIIRIRVRILVSKEKEKINLEKKWYEQENRILKAQMDPHFIFNALNSIQQFIIANDNEKAQLYLSTFAQLIRMQLESNTNENITLSQELEILEKYLEIESLRFNHAFDHEIIIDKNIDTGSLFIPYFLIQPFVENAIHHGLLPKLGYKELTITVEIQDPKTLKCTVEDNGIGRKNSELKDTPFKTKSLGVSFVQQRLLIMSKIENRNYYVEITDKENEDGTSGGTRAVITLPIQTKQ